MILGRIICFFKGHKRGKPVQLMDDGELGISRSLKVFACPRCGRETRYKVKQP